MMLRIVFPGSESFNKALKSLKEETTKVTNSKESLAKVKRLLDSAIEACPDFRLQKQKLDQFRIDLFKEQDQFKRNSLLGLLADRVPPNDLTLKKIIELEIHYHGSDSYILEGGGERGIRSLGYQGILSLNGPPPPHPTDNNTNCL
jgi:hypothetical protein